MIENFATNAIILVRIFVFLVNNAKFATLLFWNSKIVISCIQFIVF